ncbi:hypothetical protein [Chloroflexus sp.]|uniref:hypothetical protein n=1 Tax=Chloroflexus sp. TaxID=1904827 RepID=UPI00260A5A35|nr:hypothetical protein [uncultured Chloroflexus sp.]
MLIPAAHPVSIETIRDQFWQQYIFPRFWWIFVIMALTWVKLLVQRDRALLFDYATFFFCFFGPLVGIGWAGFAKQLAYLNHLLPVCAALVLVGVESYHHLIRPMEIRTLTWLSKGIVLVASLGLVMQFVALRYDVQAQIPSQSSREAGDRIIEILRSAEDPVFIPTSPYLQVLVDKPTHFHASTLGDLNLAMRYSPSLQQLLEPYVQQIHAYIASGAIKTAMLPNARWYHGVFNADHGYSCESLIANHPPLSTITGVVSYLEQVCYRRE